MKKFIILVIFLISAYFLIKYNRIILEEKFKSRRDKQRDRREIDEDEYTTSVKVEKTLGPFYNNDDETWHIGYFDIFTSSIQSFSLGF